MKQSINHFYFSNVWLNIPPWPAIFFYSIFQSGQPNSFLSMEQCILNSLLNSHFTLLFCHFGVLFIFGTDLSKLFSRYCCYKCFFFHWPKIEMKWLAWFCFSWIIENHPFSLVIPFPRSRTTIGHRLIQVKSNRTGIPIQTLTQSLT